MIAKKGVFRIWLFSKCAIIDEKKIFIMINKTILKRIYQIKLNSQIKVFL